MPGAQVDQKSRYEQWMDSAVVLHALLAGGYCGISMTTVLLCCSQQKCYKALPDFQFQSRGILPARYQLHVAARLR